MIKGKAISIDRKHVISPCGFNGLAGYKPTDGKHGSDAVLSFIPKTAKVEMKVISLEVEGKQADILKKIQSKYIDGMWTFYIKYQE